MTRNNSTKQSAPKVIRTETVTSAATAKIDSEIQTIQDENVVPHTSPTAVSNEPSIENSSQHVQ